MTRGKRGEEEKRSGKKCKSSNKNRESEEGVGGGSQTLMKGEISVKVTELKVGRK